MTRTTDDGVIFAAGCYRVRAATGDIVVEKQNPVSRAWSVYERFVSAPDAVTYVRFIVAHKETP